MILGHCAFENQFCGFDQLFNINGQSAINKSIHTWSAHTVKNGYHELFRHTFSELHFKMKLGLFMLAAAQAGFFESYKALITVRNALTLCEIEGIRGRILNLGVLATYDNLTVHFPAKLFLQVM